jgi:hypothetical protein
MEADGRHKEDVSPQLDAGMNLDGGSPEDAAQQPLCSKADFEPPAVYMNSLGGKQEGVNGSYCTDRVDLGCGICLDRETELRELTVVYPGDEITFTMPLGTLVASESCVPACPPSISLPAGTCYFPVVDERLVEEDRSWAVDLDPGVYTIWLGTHFQGIDGLDGQASYLFGLLVDPFREREVIAAGSVDAGCEQ